MRNLIIILAIFFIFFIPGQVDAASYSVDITKICVYDLYEDHAVLKITFETDVPLDTIEYVRIRAHENTWFFPDWKTLRKLSADEVSSTTTVTVKLWTGWFLNSYDKLHVEIKYDGGTITSEKYGVGLGLLPSAITIKLPDGTNKVYHEGDCASIDPTQDSGKEPVPTWLDEILNAIYSIPVKILEFFLWVPSAILNFLSDLISGAIEGISGAFGIAQPVGAVLVGMSIFIGAYLLIKLILYIV